MTMFGWGDHSGAGWLSEMMVVSSAKSAAVLAVGALAALAMRRRSAAARHLAWSIAVVGALGVPVLSVALPAWRLAPGTARPAPEPVEARAGSPEAEGRVGALPASPEQVASIAPNPIARAAGRSTPPPDAAARPIVRAEGDSAIGHRLRSMGTPSWILVVWTVGAILSGMPVLLGILSLRRVTRDSIPATDPILLERVRRLSAQAGVRRPVRVIRSPSRTIPMTWGLFRPIILLPDDAAGWPEGRLTTALLHELAHVR